MLKWDSKYELGHERIDFEHHIFLGLVTEFQEVASQLAPKEKQLRVLNEIVKYAEFHFLSEENIMEDCHYPDKARHVVLHQALLAEAKDNLHSFVRNNITADDVFQFLFEWFALHTSTEDKKLVAYIASAK